jgi:hypothetical protein
MVSDLSPIAGFDPPDALAGDRRSAVLSSHHRGARPEKDLQGREQIDASIGVPFGQPVGLVRLECESVASALAGQSAPTPHARQQLIGTQLTRAIAGDRDNHHLVRRNVPFSSCRRA